MALNLEDAGEGRGRRKEARVVATCLWTACWCFRARAADPWMEELLIRQAAQQREALLGLVDEAEASAGWAWRRACSSGSGPD